MAKEIERKFLVVDDGYKEMAIKSYDIIQGYLNVDPERTVRVRVKGDHAFLTIKGITQGCERDEWEYEIPITDAREMLHKLCSSTLLSKTRFIVPQGRLTWEVDEFHGRHEGLVIAEVELPSAEMSLEEVPSFVGVEVTGDSRYYNSELVRAH